MSGVNASFIVCWEPLTKTKASGWHSRIETSGKKLLSRKAGVRNKVLHIILNLRYYCLFNTWTLVGARLGVNRGLFQLTVGLLLREGELGVGCVQQYNVRDNRRLGMSSTFNLRPWQKVSGDHTGVRTDQCKNNIGSTIRRGSFHSLIVMHRWDGWMRWRAHYDANKKVS